MTSNVFTLDAARKAARKRYAPVHAVLEDESVVVLRPMIRLGKKDREAVVAAVDDIKDFELDEDEDEDEQKEVYSSLICESITKVIKLIADKPRRLIAELDDEEDLQIRAEMYMSVLNGWMGDTELGEAESSPS